ncbi:dTMP kinase [Candidatus Sumerlaeota bacterium]|nr:dTMP kinase [Candidatus Sumerlaeota bacterium]
MGKQTGDSSPRGWLFVFEGIDGSGKTTQMRCVAQALRKRQLHVVELFEPTKGRFGQQVRTLLQLLNKQRQQVSSDQALEVMELFIRDRMDDVEHNIGPALERGDIVLLDRYYFSTIAYQGAHGLDLEMIRQRNEQFAPLPDLVLYFAMPVEPALARIERDYRAPDLFDQHYEVAESRPTAISRSIRVFERRDFLRRVKAIYDDLAQRLPYFHTIDATRDEQTIAREVLRAIDQRIAQKRMMNDEL